MTRVAAPSTTEWSPKTVATIAVAVTVALVGIATIAWLLLRGDGGRSRALALVDQLVHAEPSVSEWQRNRWFAELMQTVDTMDREQRRALQDHWRAEHQVHLEEVLAEYRLASKPEQDVLLDREIEYTLKSRTVEEALYLGPRRDGRRGRGGRSGGPRGNRQRSGNREMTPELQERVAFEQALEARAAKTGISLERR